MRRIRPARPIAIAATALAPAVSAQTVPVLTPDRYTAAVGDEVRLTVQAAQEPPPGPLSWPADTWFFVRVAGTQENRDDAPIAAEAQAVPWRLAHAGVTMFGADFEPVVETVPGDRFARLLTERTLVAAPPDLAARASVRVRHVRSAKTLVTVGAPGPAAPDAATAVSKAGQAVEIRPLFDPTQTPVGSDLPLRMYVNGDALAKPRVVATHAAGAAAILGDGDRSTLNLRLSEPGAWRVEFHHAVPLSGDPDADWVLYSATLTFEAPGGAGR